MYSVINILIKLKYLKPIKNVSCSTKKYKYINNKICKSKFELNLIHIKNKFVIKEFKKIFQLLH